MKLLVLILSLALVSPSLAATKKATHKGGAGSCKGTYMYWSTKDKKCMDARTKAPLVPGR